MERMAGLSSMKFARGVLWEQGAVTKKPDFSLTNIAGRNNTFAKMAMRQGG